MHWHQQLTGWLLFGFWCHRCGRPDLILRHCRNINFLFFSFIIIYCCWCIAIIEMDKIANYRSNLLKTDELATCEWKVFFCFQVSSASNDLWSNYIRLAIRARAKKWFSNTNRKMCQKKEKKMWNAFSALTYYFLSRFEVTLTSQKYQKVEIWAAHSEFDFFFLLFVVSISL